MNQFKVGDTVWTIKKGIGKIIAGYMDETNRPFCVQWPSGLWSFPKLSNLYRTEAEMIAAKKCNTGHGWFSTVGFWPDLPDIPQPKFKRGDKVYYEGKKWEVQNHYVSHQSFGYILHRHNTGGTYTHVSNTPESNLRLWKEHELTHCLQHGFDTWYESNYDLSKYKSIEFIGKICGYDTFLATTEMESKSLFRGKKGDIEI